MSGWVRASNAIPEKLRMSGMIDTGKHPELVRFLAAAPFRSGTQLMIELMEDGLRLRGFAVGGVGAEAVTAGADPVKRGRGRPATRRADNPLRAITPMSTLPSESVHQPQPAPVASHEGAAMQQAESLPVQAPPRMAADTGFALEPSPSSAVAKTARTPVRGRPDDGSAVVEDGKPSPGLSSAAASMLESMLNL